MSHLKSFLQIVLCALGLLSVLALPACVDEEQEKLAEAQACLDRINEAQFSTANNCMVYLAGLDSPQANALKCSISFVGGGITTSRLISAYKQINNGANKESVFIGALVFSGASAAAALNNVKSASNYCNASGVKGLMFLANFSVMGTTLMAEYVAAGGTVDWNNPGSGGGLTINEATLTTAVNNCAAGTGSCDYAAVGNAVTILSQSYCTGSNKDQEICKDVNNAIIAAGGDPVALAQKFFSQL